MSKYNVIDKDDVAIWLESPMTQEVFLRILKRFNHQSHLLGATPGSAVDRFIGRAEVLDVLRVEEILKLFEVHK